jgi:hypothetical protein
MAWLVLPDRKDQQPEKGASMTEWPDLERLDNVKVDVAQRRGYTSAYRSRTKFWVKPRLRAPFYLINHNVETTI